MGVLPGAVGAAARACLLPERQGVRPTAADQREVVMKPAPADTPPDPAEPSPGPASQRVADYLRDAILGGDIGPGQRVRQEEIAERFGASRLPVREALRMLEAEGLIEHETNKGAHVPRLDMHEVDVIYQMRERLEPLALSESIPHLTEDDLHRLDHIQGQIETNSDVARFLALDRELHLLTYCGCHIDQLTAMVTRLWNSTQHYRRAFVSSSGPGRMWVILSLIHISEPTRRTPISYAVFCLKKKKKDN